MNLKVDNPDIRERLGSLPLPARNLIVQVFTERVLFLRQVNDDPGRSKFTHEELKGKISELKHLIGQIEYRPSGADDGEED